MAKLRFSPEENLMKILDIAIDDPAKFLGDRVYLKDHLEGIHAKFSSVYSRERSTKFSNNLYPMLASYINKLTNINYVQYQWNKREGMYEAQVLSN
jgi:CRISPR/Cas system CMR-associated protein Cmr5 small subunit